MLAVCAVILYFSTALTTPVVFGLILVVCADWIMMIISSVLACVAVNHFYFYYRGVNLDCLFCHDYNHVW